MHNEIRCAVFVIKSADIYSAISLLKNTNLICYYAPLVYVKVRRAKSCNKVRRTLSSRPSHSVTWNSKGKKVNGVFDSQRCTSVTQFYACADIRNTIRSGTFNDWVVWFTLRNQIAISGVILKLNAMHNIFSDWRWATLRLNRIITLGKQLRNLEICTFWYGNYYYYCFHP